MPENNNDVKNFKSGFAVVLGLSSSGKSTLINAVIGEKVAIVSSKKQSTRTPLRGIYTDDKSQIIFIDTPGFFKPKDKLEEYMLASMINSIDAADVIVFVADITTPLSAVPQEFIDLVIKAKQPKILAISKMDKIKEFNLSENIDYVGFSTYFNETITVSAVSGLNLNKLTDSIANQLPYGDMLYPEDEITDASSRFIISEVIRESICEITHDEIPYSIAVICDELTQRENNVYYMACTVYVERDSQKGIVIGRNGTVIKKIGTRSRQIIENVLGIKAYLDVRVKVSEKWRKNDMFLRSLGYFVSKKR
ncbi:MAG: GTPase Era [Candidatus Wallbacteria bacterium]